MAAICVTEAVWYMYIPTQPSAVYSYSIHVSNKTISENCLTVHD